MPSPHPTRSTGSISLNCDEYTPSVLHGLRGFRFLKSSWWVCKQWFIHLDNCKDSNKWYSDEKFDKDFFIFVTFLKSLLSLQLEIAEEWTMNTSMRRLTSIPALAETKWTISVWRNSSSWPHLARHQLVVLEQVGLRIRRDACKKASW